MLQNADIFTRYGRRWQAAVGVLVHAHAGADIVTAMALGRNLEAAPVPGHAIVGADDTILLDAQHVLDRHLDLQARQGRMI